VAAEVGVRTDNTIRCCNDPRLALTTDERVTRRVWLTAEGELLIDSMPESCSGPTFDCDDKYLVCENCGTERELEDD
jgi:hypothetical protein